MSILLFLHATIAKTNHISLLRFVLQNPHWILLLTLFVNYTNATCRPLILTLGSFLDPRTEDLSEHLYDVHNSKQEPFSFACLDQAVTALAIYTLVVVFVSAWELLQFLARFAFRRAYFSRRPSLIRWLHFGLMQLILSASLVSIH